MKRLSICKTDEWVSISVSAFNLWMVLIEGDDDYNEISIKQNNSYIEIKKLMQNFVISFIGKSVSSYVVISEYEAKRLLLKSDDIKHRINSLDNKENINRFQLNAPKKKLTINKTSDFSDEDVV